MLPLADALNAARERDLDLVEVAPQSAPPVCRILDYGKYKYDQAKKDKGNKHQHKGALREVRFKVKISDHDMEMKVRRAERFLLEGSKVKFSVMFRGRENAHPEIGRMLLERVHKVVEEISVVDKAPTMQGRFMNMILGPAKSQPTKVKAKKVDEATSEESRAEAEDA